MNIIDRLLPHRSPFLMVESVVAYTGGDAPVLHAERPICSSEPVFLNAEPPLYWPSVYIIEGLGQTSNLLSLFWMLERSLAAQGLDPESICDGLKGLENHGSNTTAKALLEILDRDLERTISRIGLSAAVDVQVSGRVCAGEVLHYEVERTHLLGELSRFAVRACVGEHVVLSGTMVGARIKGTV